MKKIISGLLLLAGMGVSAMAQEPTPVSTKTNVYTNTPDSSVSTSGSPEYVAPVTESRLIVPVYIDQTFRVAYPSATRTTWYKVNDDWYRVTYYDNGPWYTLGYYALRGESYPISLPVLNNAVPQEVVNAVLNKFSGVYDITETIGSDHQTQYIVRTIDAGGTVVTNRVNASADMVSM